MISLVSALVIEHGEKKIETEKATEAGSKKLMPRGEREGDLGDLGKWTRENENYTK